MRGIAKSFGSVQALRGADFASADGTIHAILGENGAGKSTLMHVLYGLLAPDAGDIEVGGLSVRFRSPRDAMDAGIGMVHQHFAQVPAMTVAENVALARGGRWFDRRREEARVRELGEATGLALDPARRVADLPVGQRQRLEIVKALARDARILILDEPTGSLAPREVDDLFAALRRLAGHGVAVVLITHKLREVAAVADRVTVMRRGEAVLTGPATAFAPTALAEAMVGGNAAGRELAEALETAPAEARLVSGAPLLEVGDLRVVRQQRTLVDGVSLSVGAGEIVGIAGVEGNGQRELMRAIAGLEPCTGSISVREGAVGFVPEDRQREGLILDFDIADNLALGQTQRFWLDHAYLDGQAAVAIGGFGIRTPGPRVPVRSLSGGNQQRVVLARVLGRRPVLIVAENPTRGLDLRATAEVHERLRRAAREDGAAVLFWSTDLDEVLALADRIAVMVAGRWTWVAPSDRTRERVGALMLGAA
jgi:simple sugar transport system ATP-binding protein